jgi:nucleotidyltransferase/DNA polymerase involved in DNA repair
VITEPDRSRMLEIPLCGPRVLQRLESIGIYRLRDLRGRDAWELMHEINVQAGRLIWQAPLAVQALQNLVDAAEQTQICTNAD